MRSKNRPAPSSPTGSLVSPLSPACSASDAEAFALQSVELLRTHTGVQQPFAADAALPQGAPLSAATEQPEDVTPEGFSWVFQEETLRHNKARKPPWCADTRPGTHPLPLASRRRWYR